MKAYITCPVSHTAKRLGLLPIIEAAAKVKGIDTFVFQVGGTPEEIFKRDYDQLDSCGLLIAEASEPSTGVGMEIGMSYCMGLELLLLHEKGTHITKLAQGMPNITIVEYESESDLKNKLNTTLDKYV